MVQTQSPADLHRRGLERVINRSVFLLAFVQIAVVLDSSDPQAGHTRTVDNPLPRRELFESEVIPFAHVVYAEQTTIDGGNDFGLAAHNPAGCAGRREACERKRFAEWANNLCWPDFLVFYHLILDALCPTTLARSPVQLFGKPAALIFAELLW